jgi:hypothetical protein
MKKIVDVTNDFLQKNQQATIDYIESQLNEFRKVAENIAKQCP